MSQDTKRPAKPRPTRRSARSSPAEAGPPERVQKVLANLGLGSRREIESWIEAGRLTVNNQLAHLGDRITGRERIRLDGRELRLPQRLTLRRRVIVYNKPEGEVVTRHDPEGRPTVFDKLPTLHQGRWIAVGRLDINSSGLLLLTTDGELANRLMHPSREVERKYAVRVMGEVTREEIQRLTGGVELEDGPARLESVREAGGEGVNRWYEAVIREGRKREVRRLWEAVGHRVSRLIRIRFANVSLGPRLFAGHWRDLELDELNGLLALAGLPGEPRPWTPHKPGRRPRPQGVGR